MCIIINELVEILGADTSRALGNIRIAFVDTMGAHPAIAFISQFSFGYRFIEIEREDETEREERNVRRTTRSYHIRSDQPSALRISITLYCVYKDDVMVEEYLQEIMVCRDNCSEASTYTMTPWPWSGVRPCLRLAEQC